MEQLLPGRLGAWTLTAGLQHVSSLAVSPEQRDKDKSRLPQHHAALEAWACPSQTLALAFDWAFVAPSGAFAFLYKKPAAMQDEWCQLPAQTVPVMVPLWACPAHLYWPRLRAATAELLLT